MTTLHLFEGYGIELEYMIVDASTLAVRAIADRLLAAEAGEITNAVERGPIGWSNELMNHVIELKTNGPVPTIDDRLARAFGDELRHIDGLLERERARVLPTGMHPTMDPRAEASIWPHEGNPIYSTYDRIFGTGGHGWANLQSCHINLPFCGAEEFGRLHLAIRPVLPMLPGLAASSPLVEGSLTGTLDNRLAVYATNQRKLPAIIGHIVPEPVRTPDDYQAKILSPMYAQIAPLDPEGELQYEWLNSRGAIARFERNAIEIRLLDTQETPTADLAIALLVTRAVRALAEERWCSLDDLAELDTLALRSILDRAIVDADRVTVEHPGLLRAFGFSESRLGIGEVWTGLGERLIDRDATETTRLRQALDVIGRRGPLARRIVGALGSDPSASRIGEVYRDLADCLHDDRMFEG